MGISIAEMFAPKYLSAADIKPRESYRIRDIQVVSFGRGRATSKKPVLFFDGSDKGLPLGKEASLELAKLAGDNPEAWIGGTVTFRHAEVEFNGDMVLSVRAASFDAGKPETKVKK